MSTRISGASVIAGVAGAPVRHSLSPLLHNAWLQGAGIDGIYVAFPIAPTGLKRLVDGFRGGVTRGLNITLPFKEEALALADAASHRARRAGAANLLVFEPDGTVSADNTDGVGVLAAFADQAPALDLTARPVLVLGAGGAARGAVAALIEAGVGEIRLVNRTRERAEAIAAALGPKIGVFGWSALGAAMDGAGCLINATSLGLEARAPLAVSLDDLPADAGVMDMVYRPLRTPLLVSAAAAGRPVVDGLAMLIGQARPAFAALFGRPPPTDVDVRALALASLESDEAGERP